MLLRFLHIACVWVLVVAASGAGPPLHAQPAGSSWDSIAQKLAEEDFAGALPLLNDFLKTHPAHREARYYRGFAYQALGEQEKAVADFNRVIGRDSLYLKAWYQRAGCRMLAGQYLEALADYDFLLSKTDTVGEFHFGKGLALLYLEQYDAAAASFGQARAVADSLTGALLLQAYAHFFMENHPAARTALEAHLKRHPTDSRALHLLALTCQASGSEAEALAWLDSAARHAGSDDLHFNKGFVALQAGRYLESINAFNQALAHDPADTQAYFFRALAKHRAGAYEPARADYEATLALHPQHREARQHLRLAKVSSFLSKFWLYLLGLLILLLVAGVLVVRWRRS